jgi:hypothetical protein
MSDVSPEDGSVSSDFPDGHGAPINITQTVNQDQDQANLQQQQQGQGTPPFFGATNPSQVQFLNSPGILIPAAAHAQAQTLVAQLQALLGL